MKLYSIYDSASQEHMPPFAAKNDLIAMRMCHTIIKSQPDILHELTLTYLGDFDIETGTIYSEVMQLKPLYKIATMQLPNKGDTEL